MAVTNAMFIFEVVIESVKSLVESRCLVIRSDFADIFSLELKDPKQMHIVMPEPPPLPPEPAGKKAKPAKPKGKGKGVELPPPEPVIQSGQSVLFSSSAEFLIQSMKKFPLELSLWSKEDNFSYIGSTFIPWDPIFLRYLEQVCNSQEPEPIVLNDEYNIFEEETAKLMAKLGMQVKLSHLGEKVTTAFRTLSEDPTVKKCLYTGINSKTTSYICTMKTTDEDFEENCNKVDNNFVVDKPKSNKIVYADYKNAPGANLTFFNDGDYCCMGHADKPPESIYKSPETCPDVDYIVDYVRKIIVSCNDNMRMLTPRPTIKPRVKATDMDRLCYCKETSWPDGKFAQKFRNEAQSQPCPLCTNAGKKPEGARGATFDIANIRGPCGRPDCRIARDLRAYIETLVEEDDKEFNVNEIIGPCGSKSCTLAKKIQEFIRHEGVFKEGATLEGLSTQCACVQKMQQALTKKTTCDSSCSKECDESGSDASFCQGTGCPFKKPDTQVYNVYYFTVEHDFDKNSVGGTSTPNTDKSSNFQYCSTDCPSVKNSEKTSCSKSACSTLADKKDEGSEDSKCQTPVCPSKQEKFPPSPADSDVVINFSDIHNPCCVKTCDVAEKVKDFIVDGIESKKKKTAGDDDCYCDCVCSFKFTKKTTYCAVCGGYECMGDDMKDEPEYAKPHPCPVYHKLYDKKYIKTPNPWPEDENKKPPPDSTSLKSSRTATSRVGGASTDRRLTSSRSMKSMKSMDRKSEKKDVEKTKVKQEKKQVGKFTANIEEEPTPSIEKRPEPKYPYPPVPKNMGWNWTAEDIPGLKPRPNWKPGAANKILVRRYRAMREGVDTIAKKKRAMMQRKKRTDTKPTLIVKKKDGEFTVQMEVFKKYSKDRLLFQYPYEEKPPLIYSIGKTEAEKAKIQKQRDRRERRETRRKSRLLQSTFRDKCQEICLKAYNQAIGVLPLPNPNDPDCPCHTQSAQNVSPPIDSCSCSDEGSISSSDTDGDEWEIQFSPPAARYDAKAKHPPVLTDNDSQYTYLDYKVKLLDKYGNQVARFFKGPDGRQECSDLGGFWTPDHVWQEINKDGYIGPDNRWVPMNFIGPDGMFYSAEEGSFTDSNGQLLKIGIDGYIDKDGKWAWYPKRARGARSAKSTFTGSTVDTKKTGKAGKPEPTSNAKGDAKGKSALQPAKGKGDKAPNAPANKLKKAVSYSSKGKNPLVMSVSMNYERSRLPRSPTGERLRVDPKKLARYKEIMQGLQQFEDFYELKPPIKTNRASNTPRKKSFVTSEENQQTNSIKKVKGDQQASSSKKQQQGQARQSRLAGDSATVFSDKANTKQLKDHARHATGDIMTGFMPSSKAQELGKTSSSIASNTVICCSKLFPELAKCPSKPVQCQENSEIVVEELKSYINCNEFYIRSQFADVFTLNLKDPNELLTMLPKRKKLKKKKTIVRNVQSQAKKDATERKPQTGQSILLASNIDILVSSMRRFPIEISLWNKDDTENRLGSTHIPWSPAYIKYLHKITIQQSPPPVVVSGGYDVFDEYTSKRMATIRLNIKLTYLKDRITTSFRSLSEDNPKTFIYTGFNSKAMTILSTVKDNSVNLMEETGTIKTIYSGGKRRLKVSKHEVSKKKSNTEDIDGVKGYKPNEDADLEEIIDFSENISNVNQSIVSLVKSDTDLDRNKQIEVMKTKSCTSINRDQYNILNYIFGDSKGPYGNQIYCVGYFTVENDSKTPATPTSQASVRTSSDDGPRGRYKFRVCDSQCPSRKADDATCSQSVCSLDLPEEAADLITVTKCKQVECNTKKHKELPEPPDERMLLDLKSQKEECCDVSQTVEEMAGGVKAKMHITEDKCFCECECTFEFMKRTTYCGICGGYEKPGEDLSHKLPNTPFPCPVFHKLINKSRLKSWSTSGSDTKKKAEDSQRSLKAAAKSVGSSKSDKNAESEKDSKKGKKKKKDDRFIFKYGFTGIPAQIGHSQCTSPCTGTLGAVPKRMGWLWTAEDTPGIKFRPSYKPGATNKHVVRLLRMAKNPGEVIAKKKRKDTNKKALIRPLLIVHKKDGEYTVTMETMKTYPKPRLVNQPPYDDKPVITYTIGRTEEENRERRKRKERAHRRLEREQRNFIQSAFKDMCNDICMKTYQQALGLLPDAEDPECPCYPAQPGADKTNLDLSCSCSEDKSSIGSDTDSDEWIVEFTPPIATFKPTFKSKKVIKEDNSSQYTYLDYRVKLLDTYGNPIPRFFKGPDGRNQCSDLGGFWSPDKKWLEINVDGYIAPDGRWAPMSFIGPGGEQVEGETGKFQAANGKWLVVGIDGYVDCQGKWKFYPKPRGVVPQPKQQGTGGGTGKKGAGDKKDDKPAYKPVEASWSCFGDVTPRHLSKLGIVGHGHDKRILLSTLKEMIAYGEDVKLPQPSMVPRLPPPKKGKRCLALSPRAIEELFAERNKCRHPVPSDKGIVEVDEHGNKVYFKMKDYKDRRPKQRIAKLAKRGISVSSFHTPCFRSFVNAQQFDHMINKHASTQVG